MSEVEQLYSFPSFIKIEQDDSILVDGQATDADIISPMEFTKVFVLPYAKIDPIEHLNRDVEGEYQEVSFAFKMNMVRLIYDLYDLYIVDRRNSGRCGGECSYTKY